MASFAVSRSFKPLPIPAALGFGLKARYTPVENVPTLFDHKFIVDRYSPKRAAVVDYYSRLPPDRLSWRVISNISSKQVNKAVLRNRLKRRWASAFAEALKNHGYYHNGRQRSGPKDGKEYIPGLRGTLEILIFSDRGITCSHRELVGASHSLVKSLVRKVKQLEPKAESAQDKDTRDDGGSTQAAGEVSSSLWSLWRKPL
ncbi:ribonuclease P protein component [Phialophora macrospora]|uniref:Ribonuclease P protein component n=1 Tax=Phialophora macrospora TaxID=1851006 RepID=A0A0D2FZ15_9EURO|nr:ribonuclease P protein component [Phialophora macrospora]